MRLEIILALVLVTTICGASVVPHKETEQDVSEPEDGGTETGADHTDLAGDDLPVPNPKMMFDEEKRPGPGPGGMGGMFFMEICTGWIEDFYDEYLVLSEDRNAVFSDLQRFFLFMDDTGDGNISTEEFVPKWMDASGFNADDTITLFFTTFSIMGDPTDPNHITANNTREIWVDLFNTEIVEGELTKEKFAFIWENDILPGLPSQGCSADDADLGAGDLTLSREDFRPDVYGYFRRKRK